MKARRMKSCKLCLNWTVCKLTYIEYNSLNHKNYNFFDCDWFKKLLFSTNSLAKLLSDSSISHHIQSCSLNQPITTLVSITIDRNSVQTPKLGLSLKWRIFFN